MSVLHNLTPVIIESPYAAPTALGIELNLRYARAAARDAIVHHGESPYLSHLLFTQRGILDDTVPDERALGIEAGLIWGAFAKRTVVYTDRGISSGMKLGIARAHEQGRRVDMRSLADWADGAVPGSEVEPVDALARLIAEANTAATELALAKQRHRQLSQMWGALESSQRVELFEDLFERGTP